MHLNWIVYHPGGSLSPTPASRYLTPLSVGLVSSEGARLYIAHSSIM